MSFIPAFLFKRLAGPIAAGLALLLLAATATLGTKLWLADRDLATVTRERNDGLDRERRAAADLGTCRGNSATLQSAITETNGILQGMRADADTREAERLRADAVATATLAKNTAALKAAKPGADKCASASALIKDFAK